MVRSCGISKPELLAVTEGGETWQGADQAWFADEWRRKAGCGPTVAAEQASYLAQTRPACKALYPSGSWEKADFLALMDQMWEHVTPGKHGVNTLHLFTKGLTAFAQARGVNLPFRELDIPRFRVARPTVDQCVAFLKAGLDADAPVAWLNLDAGEVKELDSWHWVAVTALEHHSEGPVLCTFLDKGKTFTADFRLWFHTTKAGGGLVSLPRA